MKTETLNMWDRVRKDQLKNIPTDFRKEAHIDSTIFVDSITQQIRNQIEFDKLEN